jgi:hypothetical protein
MLRQHSAMIEQVVIVEALTAYRLAAKKLLGPSNADVGVKQLVFVLATMCERKAFRSVKVVLIATCKKLINRTKRNITLSLYST